MVAQVCNPSYLESRDWEDGSLRPGKKVQEMPFLSIVGCGDSCLSSPAVLEDPGSDWPRYKVRPIPKIKKKGLAM
jgi:hypothetical protein